MATNGDQGLVVVVTGASAGLGRAVARAYAERGARIALVARGREGLDAARRDVERAGGRALVLPADVADPAEVEAAATATEEAFGPVDVWINNAMVSVFSPVAEMTAEEFKRVTEVTYLGYVYGTLAALRRMRRRDRGVIVQVGSALAYRGIPLQSAYCGAKHAIQGFMDSLRCELLHEGSRVRITMVQMPALNTPHFGWVKTRLPRAPQPVPPIFQPEVGARAVLWAADHDRPEVWVGGPTVLAIVANKLAPRLVDRYLARTAYASQQTTALVPANRPHNLRTPRPGDRGAHGAFEARAHDDSLQLRLTMRRRALTIAIATATAGAAVLWLAARAMRGGVNVQATR